MDLNKVSRSRRYRLTGLLKKNGFDRWRISASAISSVTGEECCFFIEFYIVNPAISPDKPVLGFKSRLPKTDADLQSALAGTESEKPLLTEEMVQPSFAMVKAGKLSKKGKQLNAYFPCSTLVTDSPEYVVKVGSDDRNVCYIKKNATVGAISVSGADLLENPEIMGNSGSIAWNLHYSIEDGFFPSFRSKQANWACFGARTSVAGTIVMDGEQFTVSKDRSYGYFDKNWGRNFTNPFLHLSSSNLVSRISGRKLVESCFAIQGEYNKRLCILTSIEGKKLEFHAGGYKNYNTIYECTQMPEDDDGIKLHWSVSMNNRKYIIDVDIVCNAEQMFVRDYECPEGNRKVLKLIGGGSGMGEVKVYRRIRKDLELLEDLHVESCLCEFGNLEATEK
ncbi:MAG: hypothetical protein K6G18_01640 [Treponema sp.]|nr:hypothetical protein [Treponema sp.]